MIPFILELFLLVCLGVSFDSKSLYLRRRSRSSSLFSRHVVAEDEGGCFVKTGIKRELQWGSVSKPIPLRNEISLLESGVLVKRGEFCSLENERLMEVEEECQYLGMSLHQGLLIRQQLMVSKVVKNAWKLKDNENFGYISQKFQNQGCSLLALSQEIDLPPVSILRAIVSERVYGTYPDLRHSDRKRIVKSIISEKNPEHIEMFLTDFELSELQTAKENDVVGYSENTETPVLWEEALYAYLNEQDINYVTEEMLRNAEMKVTPDCLMLDDCYINGQLVRWVDVKSFYGSGLRENKHFTKQLKKQIGKYEAEFGESGAVVFKHGFSTKLQNHNPSALFLDAGPLVDNMEL